CFIQRRTKSYMFRVDFKFGGKREI
ncbi:uncharacterized protein TNIN_36661, partial [Trichonephila inaurata madagascariensis]